MDREQLAKELLDTYITEDGSIKQLTGSSAKAIQELFQQGDIIIRNPQDLENLISCIDELDLSGTEKLALKNLSTTYKEQYPGVLAQSIEKKKKKLEAESQAIESLNQIRGNSSSPEASEQAGEGASDKMKLMIKSQYDKMHPSNKSYAGDLEKLQGWKGLDYREEAGVKIIDVPGFGEICSTTKADTEHRDMDKDGKRLIENLKDSDKFKAFALTIKNCEMMELSDTYKLMNLVASQLGITDTIDENYINTVFQKHTNENLPLEHPFGRVLRALYMMTGERFVIPISVDGKRVRSVICNIEFALFNVHLSDFNGVRPFAKIGGSAGS